MLKKSDLSELRKDFLSDKNNITRKRILNKVAMVDLVTDKDTEIDNNFNINIKTHGITDQMKSGRCWAFSVSNIVREEVIKKCNLEEFEVSVSYIAFYEKIESFNLHINRLIEYKKKGINLYDRYLSNLLTEGICDGGYFTWYANIIDKYGIVPKSVFPETFQSSNTSEVNSILSRLLRKFYLELEKNDDYDSLKEKYVKDAYTIIASVYGVPPEKFDFEYTDKDEKYHIDRDLTPKSFYEKYIGIDLLNDYVEVSTYKDNKYDYNKVYQIEELTNIEGYDEIKFFNVTHKEMKELVLTQLKNNELVCFYSYVTDKRIEGIWTDLMSRYGDIFNIDLSMNSIDIIKTNSVYGGHAMVISGVKTIDDKPVKWKIENSWGDKYGHKGDYIADDDWFNKYANTAIINKKFLSDEQLELLKQEPIRISRFDYKFD